MSTSTWSNIDDREFTDEQLLAALKRVGEDARAEAFAAGLPVYVLKGNAVVALHSDGKEEIVRRLDDNALQGGQPK
jgi:hypothetical protein